MGSGPPNQIRCRSPFVPGGLDLRDAIGRVLMAAENRGLVWLGPRTTPEGRTIDHVAVSPNGVWLVKTEPPATGRIERRDVGDWFTAEPRLYVGDQDRSDVAVVSAADEASVARALVASPLESLPIYRVLCFADVPPAWIERPRIPGHVGHLESPPDRTHAGHRPHPPD